MKRIFVINGEAGCGKDTFVSLCQEIANECGVVWNFSMVDKVKEIATMCGWDGQKTPESRKFLSDLKDLCDDFNQMSYRSVREKIDEFMNSECAEILFIHAREPEDIERLCKEFDAYSILVKRDNYKTEASNHADQNVYNFDYNYIIKNPGTNLDDYKTQADSFLECIGYFGSEFDNNF